MGSKKKKEKEEAVVSQDVNVGEWTERHHTVRRNFPGPASASAKLRVAFDRAPYTDVIAHARENFKEEICGILVGDVCEDDNGLFVHVKATIRGVTSKQGSTHVTFTHDTWNIIHKTMDQDYPKMQIVGWYHSHPDFGVEFSDMDVFAHRNSFPSATQIALVTDPVRGETAIGINSGTGLDYLDRFWVDGREHQAKSPRKESEAAAAVAGGGATPAQVKALEERVNQLLEAVNEQRNAMNRFLFVAGVVVLTGVASWLAFSVWERYTNRNAIPQMQQFVKVPVQIEGKNVLLGVSVVSWDIPPEVNAILVENAKEQQRMAEAQAKALEEALANDVVGLRLYAQIMDQGRRVLKIEAKKPSPTPPKQDPPIDDKKGAEPKK